MAFRPKRSGAILACVLLLFFASGFAALLYQTIWQRMLGFFSAKIEAASAVIGYLYGVNTMGAVVVGGP
jgi:hypothetical protein